GFEEDHFTIATSPVTDVEELVFLFKDQIAFIRPEHVAEKLVASFGNCVFSHVEKRLVVCCPTDGVYAFDLFWKQLSVSQVFDLQSVLAITGVVSRVSK